MKSEHWALTRTLSPRESRALNASSRISRRVSSRNPSFLVKVGPVARGVPSYITGDYESTRTGRFDGNSPMDKETSSPLPPHESVTEKNVGYSSPTVINARRRKDIPGSTQAHAWTSPFPGQRTIAVQLLAPWRCSTRPPLVSRSTN